VTIRLRNLQSVGNSEHNTVIGRNEYIEVTILSREEI
jgi:hypothetical protein